MVNSNTGFFNLLRYDYDKEHMGCVLILHTYSKHNTLSNQKSAVFENSGNHLS